MENYHNFKTIYKRDYLENTFPEHYHPNIVERGSNGFRDYPKENTIKTYEKLESGTIQQQKVAANTDSLDAAKNQFLKSGTEHWKSNYKHQQDVRKQLTKDRNSLGGVTGPDHCKGTEAINNSDANRQSGTGHQNQAGEQIRNATVRSSSASKPTDFCRPSQPEWSKNTFAHINRAPTGVTDYKFNYGEKIGHAPKPHIMDE